MKAIRTGITEYGGGASRTAALQRLASSTQPGSPSLSSRHTDVYITELLSYSLDRLQKEPDLLQEEEQQIERAVQANALTHYHAFVDAASCLEEVHTQLGHAAQQLDALLSEVPELADTCKRFSHDAARVMERHAANEQLLGTHTTLLELLEAPQLMDTCVRNAVYDEALDIAAFVGRAALLHPGVPAIALLQRQVSAVSRTMLGQLLSRLRGPIQLPECLRVVGYLRRMAAFDEGALCAQFLCCREEWFCGLVGELDEGGDAYDFIRALTDLYRLHLFDVIMQYRAIFFDGAPATAVQGTSSGTSGSGSGAALQQQRESAVLYSWVQHRMAYYVAALQRHLPAVTEGGNLASVLEHCMYCGASLSHVGLEFSGLLQPALELVTVQLFAAGLALAVDAFAARLDSHKWLPMPAPLFNKAKGMAAAAGTAALGADAPARTAAAAGAAADPPGGDLQPPYALMEHFPLAVLTNGALAALNELRHCALLGLGRSMAQLLQAALERAAAVLANHKQSRTLGDTEAPLYRAAARALGDVVVAHLSACFAQIYPWAGASLDAGPVQDILGEITATG